jgi:dihydrofolate reductase
MITVIAAVAKNGVIGKDGKIPWKIPEEMDHFRETTTGHIVIMGRKTWDGLHVHPLPDRLNIVISKSAPEIEGVVVVPTLRQAIKDAQSWTKSHIFIIGGASVYRQVMERKNLVDRLLISEIPGNYEGDTYFPEIDKEYWKGEVVKEAGKFDVWEYKTDEIEGSRGHSILL